MWPPLQKFMSPKKSKTEKILEKGDKYFAKAKYPAALKKYKKARELEPENPDIYKKLIESHQKSEGVWQQNDFVESLEWTMKLQELENSDLKRVHARLTPEWKEISGLLQSLLTTQDENLENALIEKINEFGENAIHPLLDALLFFKRKKLKVDEKERPLS